MFDNTRKTINKQWDKYSDSWVGIVGLVIVALVAAAITIAAAAGMFFALMWILWSFWCHIMPVIGSSMPVGFHSPTYHVFVEVFVLAYLIRNFIKGVFPTRKVTEPE